MTPTTHCLTGCIHQVLMPQPGIPTQTVLSLACNAHIGLSLLTTTFKHRLPGWVCIVLASMSVRVCVDTTACVCTYMVLPHDTGQPIQLDLPATLSAWSTCDSPYTHTAPRLPPHESGVHLSCHTPAGRASTSPIPLTFSAAPNPMSLFDGGVTTVVGILPLFLANETTPTLLSISVVDKSTTTSNAAAVAQASVLAAALTAVR